MKKVTDIDELILSLILLTCLNAITCLCVKTPFQLQCINIQCNVSKKINNSRVRFLGTRLDTRRPWGRGCNTSIGSLSNGVFERRTSTGSEVFFILKHLDAPKFVFLRVLTIIETSCPKKWAKPLSKNENKPLPVDVRRSKTSLLKFTTKKFSPFF